MNTPPNTVQLITDKGKSRLLDLPPELLDIVLKRLDSFSLWRVRETCCGLYKLIWELLSVDKVLKRYVADAKGLRGMMNECDAVISGGVALQLFEGTDFAKEMHMTVGNGRLRDMERYLVDVGGYTVDSARVHSEEEVACLRCTRRDVRYAKKSRGACLNIVVGSLVLAQIRRPHKDDTCRGRSFDDSDKRSAVHVSHEYVVYNYARQGVLFVPEDDVRR